MPPALSRFLNRFEATRQIDAAVRAAEAFERARDHGDAPADAAEHAAAAVPL